MSKRAEDAALRAYPEKMGMFHEADIHYEADLNKAARIKYIEGYNQAEKDTIEKAVMWLEKHADEYNGSESSFDHMEEEMITDFQKAMEEE